MKVPDLKKRFGDEYPAALMQDGKRIPLRSERRFSRSYCLDQDKTIFEISRFMDGSVSITASELQQEWPGWTEALRSDFCQSCCWLHERSDFPEMLRYIMQNGGPEHWSGIALSVAGQLPSDEAFTTLVQALHRTDIGSTSNISQGIAHTKHPDAEVTLRNHLAAIWAHPGLWDDANYNWVAFDATTCIAHLIELGASPSDFTNQVRQLSEHTCSESRDSCRNFLSRHYLWLKGRQ